MKKRTSSLPNLKGDNRRRYALEVAKEVSQTRRFVENHRTVLKEISLRLL